MNEKEQQTAPKLRFKGFTDDWEQRKLGEVSRFKKGGGYTKKDLTSEGSPIILYGQMYTHYKLIIDNVNTFVDIQPNSIVSNGGEIIVPGSGETAEDIAIASVIAVPGIIVGGDINIIEPSSKFRSSFVALCISNGTAHYDMARRAQGKSIVHLHNSDLAEVIINYPEISEQELISRIINLLDSTITLHEEKRVRLERLKKALLQKMFADDFIYPNIRFSEFKNPWIKKLMSKIFEEQKHKYGSGKSDLLSVTINDGIVRADSLDRKSNVSSDLTHYKQVYKNNIAYNSMRMWQGALDVSKYEGIVSPAYTVITLRDHDENPLFYKYGFKRDHMLYTFRINSQGLTSDTWNLKFPLFSKIKYLTTDKIEQDKIASLFTSIENNIKSLKLYTEKLKMVKKFLLQNMFI